ncbi:amidohydrolase family protein [Promicromonospora iranensis]|uniref:Imidazolonepropionase-like amidohydrolase n=1 Tax=Promicromonospora iranensis TaxID=1105144 RepID=A0ABU2CRJ3_9MICO|nr:hydrolase [Promicromonospora iranensis]MDR7383963.1 imidazolonepropionase-like amidohydrolase [Promicromonospora iranensis]
MPDGVPEVTLPGVVDRHVHLGLVDRALLADGPVTEVHDLGWDPRETTGWAATPPSGVRVRYVGPFHTAPGGYPSGRSWAPDAAVRHVASPRAAAEAVADVVAGGGFAVKVALHAGMVLLPDDVLRALADEAHAAGLPVVVHAEGAGQAERALDAGADTLVHVPWTESLSSELIARGAPMTWISTLAIHDGPGRRAGLELALDNARRFVAAGGTLVYGTDMGNGPTPVGVNEREIELLGAVGLTGEQLRRAVLGPADALVLTAPLPMPGTAAELIAWLRSARRIPTPR